MSPLRYPARMVERADRLYARPIVRHGARPGSHALGAGRIAFTEVEVLGRGRPAELLPVHAAAALYPELVDQIERAAAARLPVAGLEVETPVIMGVLNVTPDSFSDGGQHDGTRAAVARGLAMVAEGAEIVDIGGESTRPGAEPVAIEDELARVLPVIAGLIAAGCRAPISIDTRKAAVAEAALAAGARIFNDVSALGYDPASPAVATRAEAVCLMHALDDPRRMQADPRYDDVLLDIYDYLEERIAVAEAAGIPRAAVIVDPGIGFGKTLAHNLALIRRLSLYQTLGVAVLLGVSRKRFIGTLSGEQTAGRRAPGSIAAGLMGLDQGAQILRVHDVAETVQALRVWQALRQWGEETS